MKYLRNFNFLNESSENLNTFEIIKKMILYIKDVFLDLEDEGFKIIYTMCKEYDQYSIDFDNIDNIINWFINKYQVTSHKQTNIKVYLNIGSNSVIKNDDFEIIDKYILPALGKLNNNYLTNISLKDGLFGKYDLTFKVSFK
jgi:hypothetical protein